MEPNDLKDKLNGPGDLSVVALGFAIGFLLDAWLSPGGVPSGTIGSISSVGGFGFKKGVEAALQMRLTRDADKKVKGRLSQTCSGLKKLLAPMSTHPEVQGNPTLEKAIEWQNALQARLNQEGWSYAPKRVFAAHVDSPRPSEPVEVPVTDGDQSPGSDEDIFNFLESFVLANTFRSKYEKEFAGRLGLVEIEESLWKRGLTSDVEFEHFLESQRAQVRQLFLGETKANWARHELAILNQKFANRD